MDLDLNTAKPSAAKSESMGTKVKNVLDSKVGNKNVEAEEAAIATYTLIFLLSFLSIKFLQAPTKAKSQPRENKGAKVLTIL